MVKKAAAKADGESGLVVLWHRLDAVSRLVLLLGSPLLALALLALLLFWSESMRATAAGAAEPASSLWTRLVEANWAPRIVTVCTAVMRVVIALQASLVTAMVAAMVLERIGACLLYAPFLSIVRALPVAPTNLLFYYKAFPFGRRVLSFLFYGLVVGETLVTVAAQFLSTIYLSDFRDSPYVGPTVAIKVGANRSSATRSWLPDTVSWTFAELSEPFRAGPNFHDTGRAFRALLPFEDAARRTRLRRYRGPAVVFDARVVCVAPDLANLTVTNQGPEEMLARGRVAVDFAGVPGLRQPSGKTGYDDFTCRLPDTLINIPGRFRDETIERQTSICRHDSNAGVVADDGWVGSAVLNDPARALGYRLAMVFEFPLPLPPALRRFDVGRTSSLDLVRTDGPWQVARLGPEGLDLRISSCLVNYDARLGEVYMHSAWEGQEPGVSWEEKTDRWDSEASRRQLGASTTPESLAHRGLLALEPQRPAPSLDALWTLNIYASFAGVVGREPFSVSGWALTTRGTSFLDSVRAAVFHDTLASTGSPALAVQALVTRINQVAYYGRSYAADTAATAVFAATASVPARWTGFVAAAALVAIHLLLVAAAAALFLCLTRRSRVGDAWQAVAQVVSPDTLPLLERAGSVKGGGGQLRRRAGAMRRARLRRRPDGRVALDVRESDEGRRRDAEARAER
ncbi:hypothetical protein CDD83_3248 [Cordyceps sp. RAO-2017]|nr:hypothetical protein CDD83_3248 [Cordyceps sp. RAO-2017]